MIRINSMCVAITLFSQVRSVVQRPETLRLLRTGPERKKQVEVHALLHVVVPGAADKQSALPSCYGIILLSILRPTSDWPRRARSSDSCRPARRTEEVDNCPLMLVLEEDT